jgi:hypothetical protein
MLHEAFTEHSFSRTAVFEWHSCFNASRMSAEDDECSRRPSTSKMIENGAKIRELVHEDRHWTIHELADTAGISYGVCRDLNTKSEQVQHCSFITMCQPTCLKTTEFVTNDNMVILHHPPYSPDLAPCHFTLFLKLKMKLRRWRSETVSDIQRESQAVPDSIKENDFYGAFEAWKEWWGRCIRSQGDYF